MKKRPLNLKSTSTTNGRMIFCHFINRELHESISTQPDQTTHLEAIRLATIIHSEPLFCNVSQLFEFCDPNSPLMAEVTELTDNDVFFAHSDYHTVEEFRESRRELYSADRRRYPMYFGRIASKINIDLSPLKKSMETTAFIESKLGLWEPGVENEVSSVVSPNDFALLSDISDKMGHFINTRQQPAMTFAAFRRIARAEKWNMPQTGAIRRALTGLYIRHYISSLDACQINGLPKLGYFDVDDFPSLRFQFMKSVVRSTPIEKFLLSKKSFGIADRIDSHYSEEKKNFSLMIRRLSVALSALEQSSLGNDLPQSSVRLTRSISENLRSRSQLPENANFSNVLEISGHSILALCHELSLRFDQVAEALKSEDSSIATVLIATATDLEDKILLQVAERSSLRPLHTDTEGQNSIHYYGIQGGCKIFHVRSSAGTVGASGATLVIDDAIRRVRPDFVFSVGICAGMRPDKDSIGDVVVSTFVRQYESQRITARSFPFVGSWLPDRITPRGGKLECSALLIDRIRSIQHMFGNFRIVSGSVLSGDKLVDSESYRKKLLTIEPEAVGCEMEASGISSAASRNSSEWIMIKGICDWAAGKTKGAQETAAANAFSVFFKLIVDHKLVSSTQIIV